MTLVPAWDKRTGEMLPQRVPERWFGSPLGEHLSRTEPKTKTPASKATDSKKEAN